MDTSQNIAEVILVSPNKVRISINDIEAFKVEGELLAVGSYVKIYDHKDCSIIAIIENFSIGLKDLKDGTVEKLYIVEAVPLGFINTSGEFIRGGNNIAIPPKSVEPATREDIQKIYDDIASDKKFCFSKLVQDMTIEVPVDGNKFFNKHIAVVGSTGSGKSHTVAKILQDATSSKNGSYTGLNNSHVVIFDMHSEYKAAFPGVLSQNIEVNQLFLPYWLLNSEELQDLFIESGEEQSHNQVAMLKKTITENKQKYFTGEQVIKDKIHYDSPVFFDIQEIIAVIKMKNEEMVPGTAKDKQGPLHGKLENFLTRLENKVNDKRLGFLLGDKVKKITPEDVLRQFISYKKGSESNITIIDLSGVPFEVLSITVSLISRILFDYAYFYKKKHSSQTNETPLLIVYEEAHKYVPKSEYAKFNASRYAIEKIAKEGRKYGITCMIVSQRPSEISETIFSQCSNFISMRLTNPDDQNYVRRLLPDTLGPLTESLPILRAGEALLIGDALVMPSMVKINPCTDSPSSSDINYLDEWKKEWIDVDFNDIIGKWHK